MIRFADIERFKETFAQMISAFHYDGGLSLEHIEQKIVESDYFDFLEKNDWDAFDRYIGKSYQEMLRELFGFEFNREVQEDVGALYWAGLAYMKVFLNYKVPLKQLFMLCPLRKMMYYFEPYHEMPFSSICERFLKDDYRTSLLKAVRKSRGYTVPQLSMLTGISKPTLLYYEQANEHLFKASSENVSALVRALNVDPSVFRRLSFFNPISRYALGDKEFQNGLLEVLCAQYGIGYSPDMAISFGKDEARPGLLIGPRNELVTSNKKISVSDDVLGILIYRQSLAINENPGEKRLLY